MDNAKAPTPCGHEACNCANAEKVSPYLVAQAERAVVEAAAPVATWANPLNDREIYELIQLQKALAALDLARKGGA